MAAPLQLEEMEWLSKLGEGKFAEVHLVGRSVMILSLMNDDTLSQPLLCTGFHEPDAAQARHTADSDQLYAAKRLTLRAAKTDSDTRLNARAKADLVKEIELLFQFHHPSIVRCLPSCLSLVYLRRAFLSSRWHTGERYYHAAGRRRNHWLAAGVLRRRRCLGRG